MKQKAIFYGASNYDNKFVLLATELSYEIIAVTDNDDNQHGKMVADKYEVIAPEKALSLDYDVIILGEANNEIAAGNRLAAQYALLARMNVPESKIIPAYLLQKPKIICFGAGQAAEHLLIDIEKHFEIIGFTDNNTRKFGGAIKGKLREYTILNIYDALRSDFDYIIITSINFAEAIARQLEVWGSGIAKEKIKAPFFAINRIVDMRDAYFAEDCYSGYPILIAIDTLAIENYYGKNDFGMEIHEKHWAIINTRRHGVSSRDCIALIRSVESRGYDYSSKILLTRSYQLTDGAHRCALAIYHGNYALAAEILAFNFKQQIEPKNLEWLVKSGFNDLEINAILDKEKEIRDRINTGINFIIWGEFLSKSEEIEKDLAFFGKVTHFTDISFDCYDDFAGFCRLFYLSDDGFVTRMPEGIYFIEKKLDELKKHPLKIRILKLALSDYDFTVDMYGFPLAMKIQSIKFALRDKYQNVETSSSVLHAFDSFAQSADCDALSVLAKEKIDLTPFFDEIKEIPYTIFSEVGPGTKFPAFPLLSPKKEDIDFFCSKEHAPIIAAAAENLFKKYESGARFKTVVTNNNGEYNIKLFFNNMPAAHIHLQTLFGELNEEAVADICQNRVERNGFFVPDNKRFFLIRMARYRHANYKFHHFDYCQKHLQDYDAELMKRYFDPSRFSRIISSLGLEYPL